MGQKGQKRMQAEFCICSGGGVKLSPYCVAGMTSIIGILFMGVEWLRDKRGGILRRHK